MYTIKQDRVPHLGPSGRTAGVSAGKATWHRTSESPPPQRTANQRAKWDAAECEGHVTQVSNTLVATVYPMVAGVLRPEELMSLHHPVSDVPLLAGQAGGRGLGGCRKESQCLYDGLISHIHLGKTSLQTGGPFQKKQNVNYWWWLVLFFEWIVKITKRSTCNVTQHWELRCSSIQTEKQ